MACHVGVPYVTYGPTFFQWLRDQIIMIEDYSYVGADFHGDPDLALPEGAHWGEIGKKKFSIVYCFCHFNYEIFYVMYLRLVKISQNENVAPFIPPRSSPI